MTRDISLPSSFWQSDAWGHILKRSEQALAVEELAHDGRVILVEYRSIGL